MEQDKLKNLKSLAKEIRIAELEMFANLGFGHIGGSLSITDLFAVLYGGVMKFDPKNDKWEERDRLVVSKGHSGPALYATLATVGFFDKKLLLTLNQGGTNLPSHCDKNLTKGVDMTTGSLGQGFSTALGMAFALKEKGNWVYCVIGDGESQEGQVWECVLFASQKKLENFILFIDNNKLQLDGYIDEVCSLGRIKEKYEAFDWNALEVDGNDVEEVYDAINIAHNFKNGRPTVIILDTVKGKGAKFVEQAKANHHMVVSKDDAQNAIDELRRNYD